MQNNKMNASESISFCVTFICIAVLMSVIGFADVNAISPANANFIQYVIAGLMFIASAICFFVGVVGFIRMKF